MFAGSIILSSDDNDLQISSTLSKSNPNTAAMLPTPVGNACAIN